MTQLIPPSPYFRQGIIAGNFDVIHPGYARLFKDAKENACDYLIIALHVDPTIERPEKARPILTADERTEILMSLKHIDEVMYYNTESELFDLLKSVANHIRIIGTDYEARDFTGKGLASSIYYHKRDHDWSTTRYKTEIANQCLEQGLISRR